MYRGLHVEHPLLLSGFNETWIFSPEFRKILKYQTSCKSFRCEASCSVRMDRRADMTKLTVIFRNFANAPKKSLKNWPKRRRNTSENRLLILLVWIHTHAASLNHWLFGDYRNGVTCSSPVHWLPITERKPTALVRSQPVANADAEQWSPAR
jgi:hypothetical protein